MENKDKWLMFKNYLHNELGITKEDIQLWVKEAVQQVAQNMVNEAFGKFSAEDTVKKLVNSEDLWGSKALKAEIKELVAKKLAEQFELTKK